MLDKNMKEFLADLAAPKPTPGGGSVAALAGALAGALTGMVSGLSQKKAGESQKKFREVEEKACVLREELCELIEKDSQAFKAVMEAFRLPKETEEEKEQRKKRLQEVFKGAASVPMEVMEKCIEVMELASTGVKEGNPNCITDGGVAVLLAHAGLQGAAMNVRINLSSIKDDRFCDDARKKSAELLARGNSIKQEVEAILEENI